MAETLLKKETLNYEEVEKLIGPPPFGQKRLIEPTEFDNSISSAVSVSPSNNDDPKPSNEDPKSDPRPVHTDIVSSNE